MAPKSNWYMSKRWLATRKRILMRDGYMCRVASRYGRREPATLVHHIFPRDEYPQYQYCDWNLISVSRGTHNQLHDRDTNDLSSEGIKLLVRTARKNNIPIPEKYAEVPMW